MRRSILRCCSWTCQLPLASIDSAWDECGSIWAVRSARESSDAPRVLGILGVSPKSLSAMGRCKSRRCYFDLADIINANASG